MAGPTAHQMEGSHWPIGLPPTFTHAPSAEHINPDEHITQTITSVHYCPIQVLLGPCIVEEYAVGQ